MKFYYSLFSPVLLPPSPESSIAPSRTVTMNMSMFHFVNFILGWPVTWGRSDREALARPTARRHCWVLIGIWGLCVCMCVTMVSDSNKPQLISTVLRMWEHSIIYYTLRQSVSSTLSVLEWTLFLEFYLREGKLLTLGGQLERIHSLLCNSHPCRGICPSNSEKS